MSILRTFPLLLLLSHALPANAATSSSADCFFNWAETAYSQYFSPAKPPSQTLDVYYYRYYSGTNAYLGVASDTLHTVYLGPASGGGLVDLGDLATWLATSGCSATAPTVGAKFSIATNMASVSAAFDGSNYLVALESDKQTASVAAQMVSASGTKIGSAISIGRSGQSCCGNIAFDGTNYLMIWEEAQGANNTSPFSIYGQFISTAGVVIGQPFAMTTAGIWQDGLKVLAYGGGKYLLTYSRLFDNANNRYIAGRIISPDGTMGNEFRISTGLGAGSSIAFDGANFFVVWLDPQDHKVGGRFVSPSGNLGQEISVNASLTSGNIAPVAFDGTNYLVAWDNEAGGMGTHEYDIFGQRVSPNGTLVGGVITIANEAGGQVIPTLAFDGTNYLAVWTDGKNDANANNTCDTGEGTCWDVYGQYVGKNGVLVGDRIVISTDAGNQVGGVASHNGKSLVIVTSGIVMGSNGPTQVGESYGVFITP